MSTYESRRHDADLDARTPCPECAEQGIRNSLATCDEDHEPELLPSPETLDYAQAVRWAKSCQVVANSIRHTHVAGDHALTLATVLERHAAEYRDRADDLMRAATHKENP